MSFSAGSFSEVAFAESAGTQVVVPVGAFVVFPLNAQTMKNPIKINRIAQFSLDINTIQEHLSLPLNINTLCEFDFNINSRHNFKLDINKLIEHNVRR
tara:strand:- start:321 stop:614 length:294 start_codon:yes stop_codon:yes gene_type:complete